MGIHRSALRRRRRTDAFDTKARNRVVKQKECDRRDARMIKKISEGGPPYTPAVMSWLSRKLDKAAVRITSEDVKTLVT